MTLREHRQSEWLKQPAVQSCLVEVEAWARGRSAPRVEETLAELRQFGPTGVLQNVLILMVAPEQNPSVPFFQTDRLTAVLHQSIGTEFIARMTRPAGARWVCLN